jgi:hypothetical protein
MSLFSAYTAAIAAQLAIAAQQQSNALADVPVLIEDAQELETQIAKAIDEEGLLVLIGMPTMDNTAQSVSVADFKITSSIAVGENPIIWRDNPLTVPVCLDVVHAVIVALQGLLVQGFARRLNVMRVDYVPDKKRQLYEITIESRVAVDAQN